MADKPITFHYRDSGDIGRPRQSNPTAPTSSGAFVHPLGPVEILLGFWPINSPLGSWAGQTMANKGYGRLAISSQHLLDPPCPLAFIFTPVFTRGWRRSRTSLADLIREIAKTQPRTENQSSHMQMKVSRFPGFTGSPMTLLYRQCQFLAGGNIMG